MEENRSLFSLVIDPVTKTQLKETARWAKILAIAGLLSIVAVIVTGIYQLFVQDQVTLPDAFGNQMQQVKVAFIIFYVILLALAFFPVFYMFRFSARMNRALAANDQEAFNEAFLFMKLYFRFLGIIALISFVLVAISFVLSFIGTALVL